jgi:hypothetical protein
MHTAKDFTHKINSPVKAGQRSSMEIEEKNIMDHRTVAWHEKEMADAIAADKTGEGFIFEMFDYELGNHEYVYTCDISDTLDALGLTIEDLAKNPALRAGLKAARTAQFGGEE